LSLFSANIDSVASLSVIRTVAVSLYFVFEDLSQKL
jgi:hypothetical protein